MAKSSAKRTLSGLHQLFRKTPSQFQHSKSVPSSSFEFSSFRHRTSSISSSPSSPSKILRGASPIGLLSRPSSANGTVSRLLSRNYNLGAPFSSNPIKPPSYVNFSSSGFSKSTRWSPKIPIGLPPLPSRVNVNGSRYRFFSTKISNLGKTASIVPKPLLRNPVSAVSSAVSHYRQAVGLQTEAFWKRNYLILVGAGAVVLCVLLWRIMFGVASTFVGLSEGMAKYGFLALAAAMVSFAGMYIRARLTINPDKVYRMAMRKLNTSAGILEAMGAPLTGTELRAYVMSGGGPRLKDFKVRYGSNRCFLIFPIRGSERKGLVSVEAKKKKGQYDMKLLAVDIPMATGPDQRLFLIGDEEEYRVGGGLISELRDPIVKAMAAEKEFEDLDEKEEEEDEARELEEAERKQLEDEESAREEERKRRKLQSLERESS